MKDAFSRHALAALHFSGGKDSLACLWAIQPWWDKTVVLWVNAGDAFPSTLDLMARVRALVPHFAEVKTNAPEHIAVHGLPVDVLPVRNHERMDFASPRLQTFFECCYANVMLPAYEATRKFGATLLIRGQKDADALKGPLRSGALADGFEFLYPLEGWTDEDVVSYLADKPIGLPAHYHYVNTSLDCMHCTAYLGENLGKMRYLRERHPGPHAEVMDRLRTIRAATAAQDHLAHALEA